MDIRNCSRCGSIYAYDGFNICLKCRREDEEDFKKIKEYLDEYPGANISEVESETGVSSRKIIKFLKEGRLEIGDDTNIILSCERCGAPLKTGRFCEKCIVQMDREFKQSIGEGKDPKSIGNNKMRQKMQITQRRRRD